MSNSKKLVLILGDQLDLQSSALRDFDIANDQVIMIESIPEAQYVWSHQAKIALFLSAMRHFAQSLRELNYSVLYIEKSELSIADTLKKVLRESGITRLVCIEPGECASSRRLRD
jgi:deoxyribodipyrimidine photolyase-related protein